MSRAHSLRGRGAVVAADVLHEGRAATYPLQISNEEFIQDPYSPLSGAFHEAMNFDSSTLSNSPLTRAGKLNFLLFVSKRSAVRLFLECAERQYQNGCLGASSMVQMLPDVAKLVQVFGCPVFQSTQNEKADSLLPWSIPEVLAGNQNNNRMLNPRAYRGFLSCAEALAVSGGTGTSREEKRNAGASTLLNEHDCVAALTLIASKSLSDDVVIREMALEALDLLRAVAVSQHNRLGRFLVGISDPHMQFYLLVNLHLSPRCTDLYDITFHKSQTMLYSISGELDEIEKLMLAGRQVEALHYRSQRRDDPSSPLVIYKLNDSCSLVHFSTKPAAHVQKLIDSIARDQIISDLRKSNTFTQRKYAWSLFLLLTLERRTTQRPACMIARFLGIKFTSDAPTVDEMKNHSQEPWQDSETSVTEIVNHSGPAAMINPVEAVIELVNHSEPGAVIKPVEAAWFVREQEAGFVERNIAARPHEDEADPVWLSTFNRFPKHLEDILSSGPALQACREALLGMGHKWKLPSGTTIFVHPSQYQTVMKHLPSTVTHRHIVVASSLEHLFEQDLGTIESFAGSFNGAWVKAREEMMTRVVSAAESPSILSEHVEATVEGHARDHLQLLQVQRSFLCSCQLVRSAASVIQSQTTESDPDKRCNPRCHIATWE